MIIPPLLKLRWFGLVCPCLEDHEDTAARVALKSLSQVPVRWHRSSSGSAALASGSSATDSVGGFVSSLFGGSSSPSVSSSSSCQKIDGSLDLVDSSTGVCIQITPGAIANNDTADGELSMKQSGGYIKTVVLRNIESAALVSDGGIMGMARSAMQKSSSNSNGGGGGNVFVLVSSKNNQELLRFEILNKGNGKSVGSVEREEFLQHLNNLFAWDKKRRAALNNNESNNDDDVTADDDADTNDDEQFAQDSRNKSSPRAMGRAAKAAHFARREIELSKTKREREKKKAKYMEGSAGLKYTAIAMANRA
jgi:hypothetical protein